MSIGRNVLHATEGHDVDAEAARILETVRRGDTFKPHFGQRDSQVFKDGSVPNLNAEIDINGGPVHVGMYRHERD